ncbi:uncharacterized protein LOC107054158 isoform X6 [Gallus gallus]|uniref:uncharacterized protein LOC107054158 isoform X6 n=1 Tax=Gallus gallus TaxID=9031 RepID=UPI001AEB1AEB|nr:uncharacterized protein LOC107054158 isoform X6 [Gallus gallus]
MMMSDSVILKNNISDERRMISVTWEVSASSHHQMLQCFMSQECFCPCGASATQHKSPCCCRLCIVLSSLTFLEERGKSFQRLSWAFFKKCFASLSEKCRAADPVSHPPAVPLAQPHWQAAAVSHVSPAALTPLCSSRPPLWW